MIPLNWTFYLIACKKKRNVSHPQLQQINPFSFFTKLKIILLAPGKSNIAFHTYWQFNKNDLDNTIIPLIPVNLSIIQGIENSCPYVLSMPQFLITKSSLFLIWKYEQIKNKKSKQVLIKYHYHQTYHVFIIIQNIFILSIWALLILADVYKMELVSRDSLPRFAFIASFMS